MATVSMNCGRNVNCPKDIASAQAYILQFQDRMKSSAVEGL